MFESLYWPLLGVFVVAALVALALGRRKLGTVVLVVAGVIELATIVTLLAAIVLVAQGRAATTDTVEYFFYAVCAMLVPLAGVTWALFSRDRFSNLVVALVALTEVVMLVRMHQIWFG